MTSSALDRARVALWRASECERSMMRSHFLYDARDALRAAGHPEWADLAESAAGRIGGGGEDMRQLLFNVEREISRQQHALPEAAQ